MSDETKKRTVYGIDLGTTYSAIAYVNEDGKAEIIPNSDSERITPSVVMYDESGTIIVGAVAKETAKTNPDRAFSLIKREMGTAWTREMDGKTLTPEEISACILKRLAKDAESVTGQKVEDVVITCPAYFGDAERKATEAAGEIAGLNVKQILDEPVAAAMNYGLNKAEGDRTAIVYDLGGGTFDVTVIEIKGGNVRVVCSDGDHRLGGADWDNRIITFLVDEFAAATGGDTSALYGDKETLYELTISAEKAKKTLTKMGSAKVMVSHEGNKERVELTLEKFEEITKDLLDRTEEFTQKMIDMAKEKGITKINDFLLVGGSTRMLQVMEMVKAKFASQVDKVHDVTSEVDEAVAKGAAFYGLILAIQAFVDPTPPPKPDPVSDDATQNSAPTPEDLAREEEERAQRLKEAEEIFALPAETVTNIAGENKGEGIVATTVASRSYGIQVNSQSRGTVVYNMIKKQDPVPAEFGRDFPVREENAEKLLLIVFDNNGLGQTTPLDESKEVGRAEMMLPPGLPAGSLIKVTFKLTKDGVLEMEAIDPKGNPVRATFEAKDGLTEEEIAKKRQEFTDLEVE